jgi:hypothetical protein
MQSSNAKQGRGSLTGWSGVATGRGLRVDLLPSEARGARGMVGGNFCGLIAVMYGQTRAQRDQVALLDQRRSFVDETARGCAGASSAQPVGVVAERL